MYMCIFQYPYYCFSFILAIFRVISAVLHFGNLEFKQERNSDQALLPDNTVAQKISKLLGMSVTDFTKALLKPKIKTGREFTVRSQNKSQVHVYAEMDTHFYSLLAFTLCYSLAFTHFHPLVAHFLLLQIYMYNVYIYMYMQCM